MDLETVRYRRDLIRERLAEARAEVERCQLELRLLKSYCPHSNAYPTTHMGENCKDCPDCGLCIW